MNGHPGAKRSRCAVDSNCHRGSGAQHDAKHQSFNSLPGPEFTVTAGGGRDNKIGQEKVNRPPRKVKCREHDENKLRHVVVL
jgi:hypothetical protein